MLAKIQMIWRTREKVPLYGDGKVISRVSASLQYNRKSRGQHVEHMCHTGISVGSTKVTQETAVELKLPS